MESARLWFTCLLCSIASAYAFSGMATSKTDLSVNIWSQVWMNACLIGRAMSQFSHNLVIRIRANLVIIKLNCQPKFHMTIDQIFTWTHFVLRADHQTKYLRQTNQAIVYMVSKIFQICLTVKIWNLMEMIIFKLTFSSRGPDVWVKVCSIFCKHNCGNPWNFAILIK